MSRKETFVIAGAGLAGEKAAESLRGWGFDGRIVLAGEEPVPPYERPQLSKGYLRGQSLFGKIHGGSWYRRNEVELLTSTHVASIDPGASEVTLEPGGRLHYDTLLIATGSRARRLDVPGSDLDGVCYLRTVADADAIRERAVRGARAVVVGSGWIGGEVASSLSRRGVRISMIDRDPVPFGRIMGPEIGRVWRDLHVANGVDLHAESNVDSFTGNGSVREVRLTDGTVLPCDFAVVGVGAAPRVELAEAAGLRVERGILVDDRMRTSVPGIFAAGDVAAVMHPVLGERVRLEHWWSALTQGPWAAAGMLGHEAAYDWVPYFSSKQFDLMIEYTGFAPSWDRIVVRGDLDVRSFVAFWTRDGRVLAGMNANVPGAARAIRDIVASGRPVDAGVLADQSVDLDRVAADAGVHPEEHESEIGPGLRQWYESCPCCMSQAVPEIKQALDEERIEAAAHA